MPDCVDLREQGVAYGRQSRRQMGRLSAKNGVLPDQIIPFINALPWPYPWQSGHAEDGDDNVPNSHIARALDAQPAARDVVDGHSDAKSY